MTKRIIGNKEGNKYNLLIKDIGSLLEQGRKQAYQSVNTILVKTYWEIGKRIVEYEKENNEIEKYGNRLFENIVLNLKEKYGKGFSKSNVIYMRLLYQKYPKSQTLSDQLSRSYYFELLKIEDGKRSCRNSVCFRRNL